MLNSERWRSLLVGLFVLILTACSPQPGTETTAPDLDPTETEATLDLRYANVVAVDFEELDDGRYRFEVTLHHDDEGEAPAYADAWQVEDLDGNVLGVRELLHSHSNQPFTRSKIIEVPDDVETVVVRGHDQTHGFGGQIMRVNLRTGETTPRRATPSGG
ncbi:MAG: hypothetical protein R3191_04570 [Anaerolineales bacterium]|nr:hypothetical protein [Anaerolineales bacterium]